MPKIWMPPGVDWLLDCEPRPVQLEALARSYTGVAYRGHRDMAPGGGTGLSHRGEVAWGWGHLLEMRLGKTPLILNEYLLAKRDGLVKHLLILSPNKYKHTWAAEAKKFGVDVPILAFDTEGVKHIDRLTRFWHKNPSGTVTVVNYEALVQDYVFKALLSLAPLGTYIAADESVHIKNKASTTGKRGVQLAEQCAIARIASGKPAPQGPQDYYNQLCFIGKMDGGWNFYKFRNTFCEMGGFKGKQVKGVKNEERFQSLSKDWFFHARRKDWGTWHETDYETVELQMLPAQKQAYRTMEQEFVVWLDSGDMVSVEQAITKHMKLQQISSGFIYDELGVSRQLVEFEETPKFRELLDRLTNEIEGKTLIFAHYTETVNRLTAALKQFNPAVLRGSEDMRKAGLNVETEKAMFNHDPRCRVLIGQVKAAKYGHTLMGNPADPCLTSVYFENTYSLDDRSQTEQRNQGEGQVRGIHVMDFVSSAIEKRIVRRLQEKEHVSGIILGYYRREYNDV